MIIERLMQAVYSLLFDVIFSFEIPSLDAYDDIVLFIDDVLSFGIDIYQYFIPVAAQVMFGIVIASEIVVESYFFFMWLIKKIPIINVE